MNGTILLSILVLVAGCAAAGAPASGPADRAAAAQAAYPNIQFREEGGATNVYWGDQLLVELRQNRFVRFRATPADENWVGSQRSPADLGWVYRDEGAKGMEVLSATHEQDPAKGTFTLKVIGKKPQFDSRIEATLTATWMPQERKFKYLLSTSLACPLESWYEHSKARQRGQAAKGQDGLWTEVLDYCIEGISIPERMMCADPNSRPKPPMYEWFVKSGDGEHWEKWPKVHIPYPVRAGTYITIRDVARPAAAGSCYGFLDSRCGGWMTRIVKTPAPVVHEICWSRFDVHENLQGAIPPRGSQKDLSLEFQQEFEPVDAARGNAIVAAATELPWRKAPEYRLPLLTWDNRFDKLLTDLPGEQTGLQMLWWPSSYDCDRDDAVGFDDTFSLTICRKDAAARPTAWTSMSWASPFNDRPKTNRRYRLTAMVKTADCTGQARIGHLASLEKGPDVYFGGRLSHDKDGKPITAGLVWDWSPAAAGTSDWTPLSLEFVPKGFTSTLVLEMTGTGQCWFDNVKIEDLGPIPKTATAPATRPATAPAPKPARP